MIKKNEFRIREWFSTAFVSAMANVNSFRNKFDIEPLIESRGSKGAKKHLTAMYDELANKMRNCPEGEYFRSYRNQQVLYSTFRGYFIPLAELNIGGHIMKECLTISGKMEILDTLLKNKRLTSGQEPVTVTIDKYTPLKSGNIVFVNNHITESSIDDTLTNREKQKALSLETLDKGIFLGNDNEIRNRKLLEKFKEIEKRIIAREHFQAFSGIFDIVDFAEMINKEYDEKVVQHPELKNRSPFSDNYPEFLDLLRSFHDLQLLKRLYREINSLHHTLHKNEPATNETLPENYSPYHAFTLRRFRSKLSNIDELLKFFQGIRLVADDTDNEDFRNIFNNTPPKKPICWTGGISALSYFVKLLHRDTKLTENLKKHIWNVTSKVFINETGLPFETKKLKWQKIPCESTQEAILDAIKILKKSK